MFKKVTNTKDWSDNENLIDDTQNIQRTSEERRGGEDLERETSYNDLRVIISVNLSLICISYLLTKLPWF